MAGVEVTVKAGLPGLKREWDAAPACRCETTSRCSGQEKDLSGQQGPSSALVEG